MLLLSKDLLIDNQGSKDMSKKLNENNIGDLLVAGGVRTLLSGLGGVGAYSVAPSYYNPMMKAAYAGAGGALGHRLSNFALNKMGKNVYVNPLKRKYVPGPGGRLKKKKTLKESAAGLTALTALGGLGAAGGRRIFNKLGTPYKVNDNLSFIAGPLGDRYSRIGFDAVNNAPAGSDYSAIRQNAVLGTYARDRALATGLGAVALPALTYAGYKLLKGRRKKKR